MANGPAVKVDPCGKAQLAAHPPLDGRAKSAGVAGVEGTHCADGDGVRGVSFEDTGVRGRGALYGVIGEGFEDACGVLGLSKSGQGVRGETYSRRHAGVVGLSLLTPEELARKNVTRPVIAPGVWGSSQVGEGVHGETLSPVFAAVAGVSRCKLRTDEGVASGVWGSSEVGEGVHGETLSPFFAAVAGISRAPAGGLEGPAPGIFGGSEIGEGVHGETWSASLHGVAGIQMNSETEQGAGVYGEHKGRGPAAFFKGRVFVTEDVILVNEDCAEDFDLAEAAPIEAGTVMALAENGALRTSCEAYDRKVAGVVSGAGDFKPAIILGKRSEADPRRVPVALLGKVWCKVDASFAPIAVGDLLTTSATLGHAMKAQDRERAFGAVLGKALRPLAAGTGIIPILVALQ